MTLRKDKQNADKTIRYTCLLMYLSQQEKRISSDTSRQTTEIDEAERIQLERLVSTQPPPSVLAGVTAAFIGHIVYG